MLSITRLLKRILNRRAANTEEPRQNGGEPARVLSKSLDKNLGACKTAFDDSPDLIIRKFCFGSGEEGAVNAAIVFVDGLAKQQTINDSIIKPLMQAGQPYQAEETSEIPGMDQIRDRLLAVGEVKTIYTLDEVIEACLSGNAVFLADGYTKALDIGAKGWEKRQFPSPPARGPCEDRARGLPKICAPIRP